MSLITAYFKKEAAPVDALKPEMLNNIVETNEMTCPNSVHHSVDLLQDEDSNVVSPSPPKKMKVALFASLESPTDQTTEYIRNHDETEKCEKTQDVIVSAMCEEIKITAANSEDGKLQEQITAQLPKQQSRQTTLKFQNGKCILVPMEPSTGMETGSQESSQVDSTTEDECHPKKQERKKKKSKRKCSKEEGNFDEAEPPANKRRPSRKAAKDAAKQLSELLQETVPSHNSSLSKLTSEDDQVKLLPDILVEDNSTMEEIVTNLDDKSNNTSDVVVAEEEIIIESSSPGRVAKEATADDSSDSDVICLTPRSASPLPTAQRLSRPSTPAKNKWSHIFGTKSPQKRSPRSSPSRKSSPRKCSPRKSTPIKQVAMTLSSLATSHEQYTLGVPLFHHIMQQDSSALWSLPKVELSSINACLTKLSQHQSHDHTTGASHDLTRVSYGPCKDHLSKRLLNLDSNVKREPLNLKFLTSDGENNALDRLNVSHSSSLCHHFTLLNQQLSTERNRLLTEWASWEEQVRLVQAENERLEKEVVEVPDDPSLELVVSIRFLRTDIASESVTVDTSWYNKQQENSHTTYNLRCRRQRQSWKEAFTNSDTDNDDPYEKSSQVQKRKLKKRKKRLNRFASDDEDSSWSDDNGEKKELVVRSAPKKTKVLTKPLPGPPNFKPLNDQWVDLYAPRQPDHILGNQAAIEVLCQWLTQWKEGRSGSHSSKLQRRTVEEQSDCIMLDDNSDSEEEGVATVMLVRGPVGCGKTSAIYGCANKLGYKVFELNSSTRRSGSQVISILQEATQSHQITTQRRVTKQPTSSQEDEEDKPVDTQDIKPSRTITSFFKPIGGGVNKDGNKVGVAQSNTCKTAVEDHFKLTLASHTVILIEEVDILFEDDKGFWSAVYDIIASSKRPIICTCNDPRLVMECHHNIIDMCRPSVQEISGHLQTIALSHDVYVPAGVACTLTAMLGCDTRRVIHTLQYALCHATVTHKNPDADTDSVAPASQPASVMEQILEEAKCSLFPNLFLTNLVHQLETVDNCGEILNSRLQRPWRNHGSILKTSQSKHGYGQLDMLSSACDWLSHCDIIGSGENSTAINPNNAHCWWDVTEQSCLLDTVQQLPGELEIEKIRNQQDEIALYIEHLTEQTFSVADNSDVVEELVLRTAGKCRRQEKFNSDMLTVVQNEFTNHYQLVHSAMATDFLPYMYIMCKSEEGRKDRQRRFRHYLSARGVSDVSISSLLHHQKLLT